MRFVSQEQRAESQIPSQVLPITRLSDTGGLGCHTGFRNSSLTPLNVLLPLPPCASPFSLNTAGLRFGGAELETGHRDDLGYKLPFLQEDRERNKQIDLWGGGDAP